MSTATGLVRSELHKIRTTRLWWGLLLGAVVYTLIQAAANAALAGQEPGNGQPASAALDTAQAIRTVYAGSAFQGAYIFAMILGITGMTGEYRYQTITPTFLATPRRSRVVLAKMAAHLLVGIGYGVVCVVAALVVGGAVIVAAATTSATARTGSGPRSASASSRSGCGRCSGSASAR